ncbi:MAG: UDP-N-acetylglucosamine 2-epimerase (non-hydrolyzing) [Pirellulaceae bacterium]|nr:UDP-N-acetylglucosamine 2-epimerase (non-hydrolyzing) [Pirellulaceae bacterium]
MTPLRPLLILGTRPEAIKMAPVVLECARRGGQIKPIICFTGQHDEMLRQVTDYFGINADIDLKVMSAGQSLAQLTARCLTSLDELVAKEQPDCLVAQGDTTSVLAASMVAFYRQLPFIHVEAGLRTGNLLQPWPEEFNRRVASITTTLHAAPTERAKANLLQEGIPARQIRVTGNTVIDALLWTSQRERQSKVWADRYGFLQDRQMVLITTHRRENHGDGLAQICQAIAELARMFPDIAFILPVHLNPYVKSTVEGALAGIANVHLLRPLPYPEFVWLMDRAKLILSDSGGVQEESPSLKRPVLVLRETTERQEAVECGAVALVGADRRSIVTSATRLLMDEKAYRSMQVEASPYGDGRAAIRIVDWLLEHFAP